MECSSLIEAKKKLDAIPLQLSAEQKERIWLCDIVENALKKAYYEWRRGHLA